MQPDGQERALALVEELDRVEAVRRWCEAVVIGRIDPAPEEFTEVARIVCAARSWRARALAA
jgi:hypothetical protein